MIKIELHGTRAVLRAQQPLTVGCVGEPVYFSFSSQWDALSKTAVFRQGQVTVDVAGIATETVVPWEVLQEPGVPVDIGVYGTNSDGTVVIPTVWTRTEPVQPGADPLMDGSTAPTLPVWQQLLNKIGDLSKLQTEEKESLVGAINEASRAVCLVKVDETGTADKTLKEIGEGYRARKLLLCLDEPKLMLLPFVADEDGYRFGAVVANTEHWVHIGQNGVTRGSTDLVTISDSLPNPYRLNFIGAVEAEYDGSADVAVELPSRLSQLENDAGYLTEAPVTGVNGQTGDVEITLPQSLPNPQKLSVTGIARGEYDGSEAVTLEIPGVLYVKITGTGDALASDVSHTQIQQAYRDGRTVACQYSNVLLPLLRITGVHSVFGAVYNGSIYTVTVRATGTVTATTGQLAADDSTVPAEVVLYTPQELSFEQKAQARANIGVGEIVEIQVVLEEVGASLVDAGVQTVFDSIAAGNTVVLYRNTDEGSKIYYRLDEKRTQADGGETLTFTHRSITLVQHIHLTRGGFFNGSIGVGTQELTPEKIGGVSSPLTAAIGQALAVKAVDETGKPTQWEAADLVGMPTADDWEKITSVSFATDEETVQHIITLNENGNEFGYDQILILGTDTSGSGKLQIWLNSETQYAGQGISFTDFFGFGKKKTMMIERLLDRKYLFHMSVPSFTNVEFSSNFEKANGRIHTIVLTREATTNQANIAVYGRNYK